jgi:hypothetical protein
MSSIKDFTFVVKPTTENGRTLLARVKASSFDQALNTALSVHPNHWLKSAHAPKRNHIPDVERVKVETTDRKQERIKQLLTNKKLIPMVLFDAKNAAQKESKAQKGKKIFVYNDEKAQEVEYGSLPIRKGIVPLHCYLNGKEVELAATVQEAKAENKEVTQTTKNNIQTKQNSKVMKTAKKASKKSAKKAAAPRKPVSTEGKMKLDNGKYIPKAKKVKMAVKDIVRLMKKGTEFFSVTGLKYNIKHESSLTNVDAVKECMQVL